MSDKRKRGRPRIEARLGDLSHGYPVVQPELRFRGGHYRLLVGTETWANDIAACMAQKRRFADALKVGVLIRSRNESTTGEPLR